MRSASFVLALLTFAVSACGSGGGTEPGAPASITLLTPQDSLVPAELVQLDARVKDANGTVIPNEPVTFTSSSAAVATVTNAGVVTGVAPGDVTISAVAGTVTGQLPLVVTEGGVLTAAGGTVTAYGGGIEVTIPAGALAATTAIRLLATANPLLDPTAVTGTIYEIHPVTLSLTTPASVRVRYNPANGPAGLPVSDLRVRGYDGSAWAELPNGTVNLATSRAEASISTGGTVSVGWVAPSSPCTSPESRQFDFWVGAWSVSVNGTLIALSDITLVPGGCAVLEHFRPFGAANGKSISFYQPATSTWYQTYVDDDGFRLTVGGSYAGGAMDLYTPVGGTTVVHQRWRWTVEGSNVRQQAALTTNGGTSYGTPFFNGLYAPR